MDIRLGRLKMPIENSLSYYELPSEDASDTNQPSSSVPSEKPLASKILTEAGNNCQTEQCESPDTQNEATRYNCLFYVFFYVIHKTQKGMFLHTNHCRSLETATLETRTSSVSSAIPDTQTSEPVDIKEEKKEEEEDGVDIRDKIRNAFGDDSDSD